MQYYPKSNHHWEQEKWKRYIGWLERLESLFYARLVVILINIYTEKSLSLCCVICDPNTKVLICELI